MSDPDDGNKTVFRPSPLAARKSGGTLPPGRTGQMTPPGALPGQAGPAAPPPASQPMVGLAVAAAPALSIATAARAGNAGLPLPQLHQQAAQAVAQFAAAIQPYPEAVRQRAIYAVSATIDDVAQHSPMAGSDGAEWALRSMVAQFSGAEPGGDRFGQIVDEVVRHPGQNRELIDLLQACLAAGFEGPLRGTPDAVAAMASKLQATPAPAPAPRPAPAPAPTPAAQAQPSATPRPPRAPQVEPTPAPAWQSGRARPAAAAMPGGSPISAAPRKRTGMTLAIVGLVLVLMLALAYVAARMLLPPGTSIGPLRISRVDTVSTPVANIAYRRARVG